MDGDHPLLGKLLPTQNKRKARHHSHRQLNTQGLVSTTEFAPPAKPRTSFVDHNILVGPIELVVLVEAVVRVVNYEARLVVVVVVVAIRDRAVAGSVSVRCDSTSLAERHLRTWEA